MPRPAPLPLVEWSPILNVGFLTIPVCAGLLGGWFQFPLIAVALCVPQSGYLGWFYRTPGAVAVGLSALVAWWLPYLWETSRGMEFDVAEAVIGPVIVFLFAGLNARLRSTVDQAQLWAETDSLTGLLNRAGFERQLGAESNRSQRNRTSLAVAFLDCDNFKPFNDSQGHAAGDQLLVAISELLQTSVRNYDSVARLGGDEFAILLAEVDTSSTQIVLNRLQTQLNSLAARNKWPVSWSIGAVVFTRPQHPQAMIEAADKLMYQVKRQGKGSTLISEQQAESSASRPQRTATKKTEDVADFSLQSSDT